MGYLRAATSITALLIVVGAVISSFMNSRQILNLFKSEVPSVTEVWEKFGKGFGRAETHIISSDLLAAMYLVEKEFDHRSELNREALTFHALFAKADVPSLFQRGALDFLPRTEVCAYKGRLFASEPHPCQRLRPLHRNLHQMSAYLTFTVDHLLKKIPSEKLVDLPRKQTVAMLVYFCGAKEAARYVQRDFMAPKDLECAGLPMLTVMRRVKSYQRAFERAQALTSV